MIRFFSELRIVRSVLERIRIVLVNTSHPGNIGAVARAMKTMGLTKLVLVSPDEFPHPYATSRAAGADDILAQAMVVESLADAVADCQLVVGTSARQRKVPWPLVNPRECAQQLLAEAQQGEVALIFGREEHGLTNDELAMCQLHVHIPANETYSSLNLGAAVQVMTYEIRMQALQLIQSQSLEALSGHDAPLATSAELEHLYQHLEQTLQQINFLKSASAHSMMTKLRRIYQRARLERQEVQILRGILSQTQNKAKNK